MTNLSVLANCCVGLVKSRTCRGLTTVTGNEAAAKAASRGSFSPPAYSVISAVDSGSFS